MTTVVTIAVTAVVVCCLFRRRCRPRWRICWSPGMPNTPTMQGDGWYFNFPARPDHHVHYVQDFTPPALAVGRTLTARFRIDGDAKFAPQEWPAEAATVSLLIQRKGDDWSAKGKYAAYRWYSGDQIALSAGEHVLSVPLTADAWGDVYGGHDPQAFSDALAHAESVGLVFGSTGGRGHGVYATHPARFSFISMITT